MKTPVIVQVEQGTEAWSQLRARRLGASEAATVMGISPWKTIYQLWRQILEKDQQDRSAKPSTGTVNWAIERGNRLEPVARARYELISDLEMPPMVFIHPEYDWMLASLDGMNLEHGIVLEIKIPGAKTVEMARRGEIPEHYRAQMEQQLEVTGAKEVHFYVGVANKVNGRETVTDGILIKYKSDPELKARWLKAAKDFWGYVERDEAPPLTEKDTLILESEDAKETFSRIANLVREHDAAETAFDLAEGVYLAAKKEYERVDQDLNEAKKTLTRFLSHHRVSCGDLQVTERTYVNGKKSLQLKVTG